MGKDRKFRRAFRLDRSTRADARNAVDEELGHHLELAVEELVEAGWREEEAREEARRRFGDVEEARAYMEKVQIQRERRERTMKTMSLDELRQDVKYALRSIRKAPGYAGLVVLTLAFGIAANTTIFSVMNPYLFRALPYDQPEELVQVNQVDPVTGWDMARFSYPQYLDWKERSRSFDAVGAYNYGAMTVTGDEGPEQIQSAGVTADLFDVLGAPALLGRTFLPDEGTVGGEPVVLIDHGLWERRYNADPGIIGRTVTLDGRQHTVVGVMAPDFVFPFGGVRIWTPIQASATDDRSRLPYQIIGRLADGRSIEDARTELAGIQAELSAIYPDVDGRMAGVTVKPVREALNFAWDVLHALFYVLIGAVAFVLLIACANVASLTLARAGGRIREVSVRAALGAPRARIVRQLFTESLVLALAGGALGVAMAYGVTGFLDPIIPEDLFKVGSISVDGTVLAFSALVTLATPLVFGLAPALSIARLELVSGLKEGSKGTGGRGSSRSRQTLVVAQVALAVVLITGAGLMLRSFASVQRLDLGFDADRLATAELLLPAEAYPTPEERTQFMEASVAAAQAIPGVTSASAVQWLPLNHENVSLRLVPGSMAGTPAEEWPLVTFNRVHAGYFRTMGIDLVAGREFSAVDGAEEGAPVVVVNRTLARRHWPEGGAVGQTVLAGEPDDPTSYTVVGVVDDVHHVDLDPGNVGGQLYAPVVGAGARRFFVVAGIAGSPEAAVPALRTALADLAPDLPARIRPMDAVVAENQLQWSISSVFMGIFGGGALLLATLGIYGLISYSVSQRQREMALRIALGATDGEIRRRVVGDGVKLTAIGLVIGIAAALGLGRLLSTVLYGVGAADPATLGSVLGLFLAVAALASLVPAARAARASPIDVLRSE